jgi:hypothetical protein
VERWEVSLEAVLNGERREGMRLRVRLHHKGRKIVDDVYSLDRHHTVRRIVLPDPGIDDYRGDMLWSSESHPNLLRAEMELVDEKDEVIDRVESYTAMRSVATQGNRIHDEYPAVLSADGAGSGVLAGERPDCAG